MDQASTSTSKPGPLKQAVNLDPTPPRPRPTSHTVEAMEVDYGPSLPPRLGQTKCRQQNGHCIHRCSNRSVKKWFTPHVDLFATRLNHKLPLYVSPVPDPNAWDVDALKHKLDGSHCLCLPSDAFLHRVIPKIRQCSCLIIVIAPGWPGMPWFWDLMQLSTEILLQLPVSTNLLKQSHNYVFHSNPQHVNLNTWCLGVDSSKKGFSLEVAERIAAPQRSSTRTIYSQSGPYWRNGAVKIWWISPLPL